MEIFTELHTQGTDVHKFGIVGDPTRLDAEVSAFLEANPGYHRCVGYTESRSTPIHRDGTRTTGGGMELTFCAEVAKGEVSE